MKKRVKKKIRSKAKRTMKRLRKIPDGSLVYGFNDVYHVPANLVRLEDRYRKLEKRIKHLETK